MTATEWRGRLDEQPEDLPIDERAPRRREARALLGSLLAPFKMTVGLLALVVVVENAARLSVPLLVQRGIDHAIPPLLSGGSARELVIVVAVLCGVVSLQAISRLVFLNRSGRIGQRVLLEVRRRVFRHFQRLDVAFHDRYTSGRVVSRLTNDVEAIQDMLETGFDSLITAVLTLFGTAILLVALDVRLGLMCLTAFPILVGLVRVVLVRVGQDLPPGAGERRAGDRAVRRDDDGDQSGTGLPPPTAESADLRRRRRRYREDNEQSFRLLAIFMPAVKLVGNLTTGAVLLYGGYRVCTTR